MKKKTKTAKTSTKHPNGWRFNKKTLLAFVALFAIVGAGYYIAVASGGIRIGNKQYFASASSTFSICSKRYVGCIEQNGAGNQVLVSRAVHNHYRRVQAQACAKTTCYRYQDTATGRCLKYDPGVAKHPVVEGICDGSGDVTTTEEEWGNSGGVLNNLYAETLYLYAPSAMADLNGQGTVTVQSKSANGTLWLVNAN